MSRKHETTRSVPAISHRSEPPDHESAPAISPELRRRCQIGLACCVAVMFALLLSQLNVHIARPADHFTDMNVLMSGEDFANQGFLKMHFLPVHFVGEVSDQAGYYTYYTHYPPLPNVFNGLLRVIGINSLPAMRLICGLTFIAGIVCLYYAFAPIVGPLISVCGVGFFATTGFFLGYCTSLHHAIHLAFAGVFFLCFLRALDGGRFARLATAGAWLSLFLGAQTSFEYILHLQAFAWVYVLATGQLRARWRLLILLGIAPVLSVGLHYLQVVWALGWAEAWNDRLGFRHIRGGLGDDRWIALKAVPSKMQQFGEQLFYWTPQMLLIAAVALVAVISYGKLGVASVRRSTALLLALVVGSLMWFIGMPYHAVRHPHTMGQFMPLVIVVMGGVTVLAGRFLFSPSAGWPQRVLGGLVGLVLLFGQGQTLMTQLNPPLDRLAILGEAIGPDALPPHVGMLSNAGWSAQLGYFLRRPYWLVPNTSAIPPVPFPECLPTLQKHLPPDWPIRYYLFASWGDRSAFQLLASTCPGQMLRITEQDFFVLFDITALHLPPDQRPPLDATVEANQLKLEFPPWQITGYIDRLKKLVPAESSE